MEPHLNGGSTPTDRARLGMAEVLQWSPPLKDGSTGPERRQLGEHPAAAMEPAAERREHPNWAERHPGDLVTAMEPAAERREGLNILGNIQLNDVSQWSLPLATGAPAPTAGRHQTECCLNGARF